MTSYQKRKEDVHRFSEKIMELRAQIRIMIREPETKLSKTLKKQWNDIFDDEDMVWLGERTELKN